MPTAANAASTGLLRDAVVSGGRGGGGGGGATTNGRGGGTPTNNDVRLPFNYRKVRYFDAITASDSGVARRFLRGEMIKATRARGRAFSDHLKRARSGGRGGGAPGPPPPAPPPRRRRRIGGGRWRR